MSLKLNNLIVTESLTVSSSGSMFDHSASESVVSHVPLYFRCVYCFICPSDSRHFCTSFKIVRLPYSQQTLLYAGHCLSLCTDTLYLYFGELWFCVVPNCVISVYFHLFPIFLCFETNIWLSCRLPNTRV